MRKPDIFRRRLPSNIITLVAIIISLFVGILVIIGWQFDIPLFKSILPGYVSMKVNTAIGFILLGSSLFFLWLNQGAKSKFIARGFALSGLILGLLVLSEYLFPGYIDIDQTLFHEAIGTVGTFSPGRMALTSVVDLILLSIALLLLSITNRRAHQLGQLFALISLIAALSGFEGYLLDLQLLYGIGVYTRMAMHTALTFIILSIGILSLRPSEGLVSVTTTKLSGGIMFRRLFPFVIVIPLLLSIIGLKGAQVGYYEVSFGISLIILFNVIISSSVLWWNARKLNKEDIIRIAIQNDLKNSEERYHTVLEQSSDAIVVHSGGKWVYVNNACLKLVGATNMAEIIGKDMLNFVHPDWLDQARDRIKLAQQSKQTLPLQEFKLLKVTNEVIDVEVISLPVTYEGRNATQLIIRDISLQKSVQLELERERASLARRVEERTADLSAVNAQLAGALRLKDEFLANMSHELRTPLNVIIGLSESLDEGVYGKLSEKQTEVQLTIAESGNHLLKLINDILDLSKINAGKFELAFEVVDVETLVQSTLRLVKQSAFQKQIQIFPNFDSSVTTIQADSRRLKQILINLLSNALKFTPNGGSIGLEVKGNVLARTIDFVVWDTGIGISNTDMGLLFKPFVQLDSGLSRQHNGTGLGLALVYHLVDLHGGMISLESELGKGSRFTVSLPWPEIRLVATEIEIERDASTALFSGRKVLIVDDSTVMVQQLKRYLAEINVQTITHTGVESTFDIALSLQPDLIILDLLLPSVSGWDVLAQLKTDPRTLGIPVIIISVLDDPQRATEAGAADYLLKPISRQNLYKALHSALAGVRDSAPPSTTLPSTEFIPPDTHPVIVPEQTTILIAEDNENNINLFNDYLLAQGYQVMIARNGEEALSRVEEKYPDLILMDIQMPRMDGLEAIKRLRANPLLPTMPIIALTALTMPGDRERCLEAGANGYLSKPVDLGELIKAIEQQLNKVINV